MFADHWSIAKQTGLTANTLRRSITGPEPLPGGHLSHLDDTKSRIHAATDGSETALQESKLKAQLSTAVQWEHRAETRDDVGGVITQQ